MTNRHSRMYASYHQRILDEEDEFELQMEDSDDSDTQGETQNTEESQEIDFSLGMVTNKISVVDSQLFEENDLEFEYDTNINPLDQGLLFKLLFKKFNDDFISKSNINTGLSDTLLMTSIFSKLASVPLCDKNIETYYLHAFMYCELKNDSVSLIRSLVHNSNEIKRKSNFEEFSNLKAIVKTRLSNPGVNIKLQWTYNRSIDELK